MGRIGEQFARLRQRGESALVPFLMAGDPDLGATKDLLRAAVRAGADLIELGVPFSDPTADGPVLQRSAAHAIERGTSLRRILEMLTEIRHELPVPIILFGYYNPIFHYGPERLVDDAKRAGVDALLVVDLPPEEADELWKPLRAAGLDQIFLLAPTSDPSRIRSVLRKASGFVYYVSMTGITGSTAIALNEVGAMVAQIRKQCALPIGVGFGITSASEAVSVAGFADAVVVGTAIMRLVEAHREDPQLVANVESFIRELKGATRKSAESA